MCHQEVPGYADLKTALTAADYFLCAALKEAVLAQAEAPKWKVIDITHKNSLIMNKKYTAVCSICHQLLSYEQVYEQNQLSYIAAHLIKAHKTKFVYIDSDGTAIIKYRRKKADKVAEEGFTAKYLELGLYRAAYTGENRYWCNLCKEDLEALNDQERSKKIAQHFHESHQAEVLYNLKGKVLLLFAQPINTH